LLPSGKVLVAGGLLAERELYEPTSGTWTATGSLPPTSYHTATLLPNGKVLVAGDYFLASAELYDRRADLDRHRQPRQGTPLSQPRRAAQRQVLVAAVLVATTARSCTIRRAGPGRHRQHGLLTQSHGELLPNGKVLVAGWFCGNDSENSTIRRANLTATGSLHHGRYSHNGDMLPNGKVLVAAAYFLASAELYDPGAGLWTATGGLATVRVLHTATLLPNGKVLAAGGVDRDGIFLGGELYDSASGAWTPTGSLATTRSYHTATLLPSGKCSSQGSRRGLPPSRERGTLRCRARIQQRLAA